MTRPIRRYARPIIKLNDKGQNKTESRYESEVLKPLLATGDIVSYQFEGLKLRLAKATFYSPDFVVVTPHCIELHEVKGKWEEDARVKIKVAARQFPFFSFIAIQHKRRQWSREFF